MIEVSNQTPQLLAGAIRILVSKHLLRCKNGGRFHHERFHQVCIHSHLYIIRSESVVLPTNSLLRSSDLEQKHENNLPAISCCNSMQDAESAGCITISGMELFLGQAAEQFRLFTGRKPPPASTMRALMADTMVQ